MKPLYIFDLDGTLALCDHRSPLLNDKSNPNRWDDFYKACVLDLPNIPIITVLNTLLKHADVYIFSGRSKIVFEDTLTWLTKNTHLFEIDRKYIILCMREIGNNTPDEELKFLWYNNLSDKDKDRLVCVFDNRQKVVDMWRLIGVTCCQVAKGDF